MKKFCYHSIAASFLLGGSVLAGTDTWFVPLTESAPVVAPNAIEELSAPWVTPEGINQRNHFCVVGRRIPSVRRRP